MDRRLTTSLPDLPGFELHPESQASSGEAVLYLASRQGRRCLIFRTRAGDPWLDGFHGERSQRDGQALLICAADQTPNKVSG